MLERLALFGCEVFRREFEAVAPASDSSQVSSVFEHYIIIGVLNVRSCIRAMPIERIRPRHSSRLSNQRLTSNRFDGIEAKVQAKGSKWSRLVQKFQPAQEKGKDVRKYLHPKGGSTGIRKACESGKDSSVLDLWMHHALDFVIDCRAMFCSAASHRWNRREVDLMKY